MTAAIEGYKRVARALRKAEAKGVRGGASPTRVGPAETSLPAGRDASLEAPNDGTCAWCGNPIPSGKRRDSKHCGKRCRQSAWRFARHRRRAAVAAEPRSWAYADPPYPGLARYYIGHPDYGGEVDHRALLSRLQGYDGWALSTSAEALPTVLGLVAELGIPDIKVAAWLRGARPGTSEGPRSAWEPVLYRGERLFAGGASPATRTDALAHVARARTSDVDRVIGAKPSAFAFWMFELLGAQVGDELDDLFPGSRGIGRAWSLFQTSPEALGDASLPPARDASPRGLPDASLSAEADTSSPELQWQT